MPATHDLYIPYRAPGSGFGYPVKAGMTIYGRALVGLTAAGLAVPVGHADCVAFAGIAVARVDNSSGVDGAQTAEVQRDVRGFTFAATPADLNKPVYATDDATLTLTANGALKVGVIVSTDADRIWVDLGL